MCEHWHKPTNTKLLTTAIMAVSIVNIDMFVAGRVLKLWDIRPGVGAWTFSYFAHDKPDDEIWHWHNSLTYYYSEFEAKEAMANFVRSLNADWRAS